MIKISKRNTKNYLNRHALQRKLIILGISILLALMLTAVFQYFVGLQIETLKVPFSFTISNETVSTQPIEVVTNAPNYFVHAVKIYAYQTSPYASAWTTFDTWLSLNDSPPWVTIPLLTSQTDNRTEMAYLGTIQLSSPTIYIYQKYYIPPQTLTYNGNATNAEIENSFSNSIQIVKQPTSEDTALTILTFFALLAITLQVYDFLRSKASKRTYKQED